MTREEMANVVDSAIVILKVHTLGTADLREVAAELRKVCEWRETEEGYWTSCGKHWFGGSPSECWPFCGYCGGTLIDVPYVEPTEEPQS